MVTSGPCRRRQRRRHRPRVGRSSRPAQPSKRLIWDRSRHVAGRSTRNIPAAPTSHQDGVARDERGLVLGGTRRTPDLHDVVLVLLGTGMRIGEALALEWADLDLDADIPHVRVAATMVEPRREPPAAGIRSRAAPSTDDQDRCDPHIALPGAAVEMLNRRRAGMMGRHDRQPVFAHAGGGWLWPNNVRTKLRGVAADTPWPESARTRYVARWAPWSLTARAWTPPGTSWATATPRSPHALLADTGRVIDARGTRWTQSSRNPFTGSEVVGRAVLPET